MSYVKADKVDVAASFARMSLYDKKEMLELIIFQDMLIFNEKSKSLDDGSQVARVSINGPMLQLTIKQV